MITYAFVDAAGYVTGAGSGPRLLDGAVELPAGVMPVASVDMQLVDGAFIPRPALAAPEVTVFETSGRAVRFTDLPAGTAAEIVDVDCGYSIASLPEAKGLIEIALPEPGRYRIEVTPPRPYLPLTIDLEGQA